MIQLKWVFLLIFLTCAPVWADQNIEDADFALQMNSLTDRVRAQELRIQSMDALVRTYPHRTFPALVSLMVDPQEAPSIRYLAADKLRQVNQRSAAQTFLEILDDRRQDDFARRTALAQLVIVNQPPLRQRVVEILDNSREDPALRQYALGIYSSWDEKGKIERLRSFATSNREPLNMKTNALFLLESLQDFNFVRSQIHKLLVDREQSEELRKNSIVMAERMKDQDAIPLLARIAQDAREPSSLRQLAETTRGRMKETLKQA